MQQSRWQWLVIEWRRKAEHIGIENQSRTHTGTEGIPVDSDDAGQSAAVRVEGTRGVVGLNLEDDAPIISEADNAGIVLEHRETDVVIPCLCPDIARRAHDIALEQRVDRLLFTCRGVFVVDCRSEDLVLAVFTPGLRQGLELAIGQHCTKTDLFAIGLNLW